MFTEPLLQVRSDWLEEHLRLRPGEEGEYWPENGLVGTACSRGLWKYEGGAWRQVITAKGDVLSPAAVTFDSTLPPITEETSLFRIANKDQFVLCEDKELPVHLSPQRMTLRYNDTAWLDFAQALADEITERPKPTAATATEGLQEKIRLINAVIDDLDQTNRSLSCKSGRRLTWRQVRIAKIIADRYQDLLNLAQAQWSTIRNAHRQLIYIYNGYLGTFAKPMLEFGHNTELLPPDLLNMFCDVRFFSPQSRLQSAMNYLLFPAVFRHQDIYQRATIDETDFVVVEIPYAPKLASQGLIELTDYGTLRREIRELVANLPFVTTVQHGVRAATGYARSPEREQQLVDSLDVWGDVFQEVRLRADFLVPRRFYLIKGHYVRNCPRWPGSGPCPVCSRFELDTETYYDVSRGGDYGIAVALFGRKGNQVMPDDSVLLRFATPQVCQVGFAGGSHVTTL